MYYILILLILYIFITVYSKKIIFNDNSKFYSNINRFSNELQLIESIYYKNASYIDSNGIIVDYEKRIFKKCNGYNCKILQLYNKKKSIILVKNKKKTNELLNKYKIPIPSSVIITKLTKNEIMNLIKNKLKYPLVAKPLYGSEGVGVNTNINNFNRLESALNHLFTKYNNILIENQLEGNIYRVLVVNNRVIDVLERLKPYVIGDGNTSLLKLIEKRNEKQLENKDFITYNLTIPYINEQGYELSNIIENNKKVYITNVINYRNGSIPIRIPIFKIPQENIDLFIKSTQICNLNYCGIDFISHNIMVPYYKNNGKILELNASPGIISHKRADYNNTDFLFTEIEKLVFNL